MNGGGTSIGLSWKPTEAQLYGIGKGGYDMLRMHRDKFNVNVRGDGYVTISGARSGYAMSEGFTAHGMPHRTRPITAMYGSSSTRASR